jgi:hypothetical protein
VTTPTYQPVDPAHLADAVAELLAAASVSHPLRVAIDGARCAAPVAFAQSVIVPLQTRGRAARVVDAETFWRDASLRFEYGHTDLASYAQCWLDVDALRREVLHPLGRRRSGRYLPALRDPDSNRSLRVPSQHADERAVIMVAGELLLGRQLPFDRTIHLAVDSAARKRRTPPDWQWTLPAHDAYDRDVQPTRVADIVVRWNDPRHPALRIGGSAQISPDSQQSMR